MPTDNHGVNRIGGFGDQGIHEESSTQKHSIGEKLELADGRCFRYGYFAAATAAGLLVSQDVSAGCVVETDDIATAAAIGATSVILTDAGTLGSATANQYAGGYLHITDDAGEGYTYRIKSNTAASSNAVTFTLYDPLVVALTTASDVAITGNMYNNLLGATAATDTLVSGVTTRVMQASYYGWVQTKGVSTVLADIPVGITFGDQLTLSDGVAGAVQLQDAYTEQTVGYSLYTGDDTGHVGVMLNIS